MSLLDLLTLPPPRLPCRRDRRRCRRWVQLLEVLSVEGANPVVLAGDSHNAWAHEIVDDNGTR